LRDKKALQAIRPLVSEDEARSAASKLIFSSLAALLILGFSLITIGYSNDKAAIYLYPVTGLWLASISISWVIIQIFFLIFLIMKYKKIQNNLSAIISASAFLAILLISYVAFLTLDGATKNLRRYAYGCAPLILDAGALAGPPCLADQPAP
jgi:hypothetical protein